MKKAAFVNSLIVSLRKRVEDLEKENKEQLKIQFGKIYKDFLVKRIKPAIRQVLQIVLFSLIPMRNLYELIAFLHQR